MGVASENFAPRMGILSSLHGLMSVAMVLCLSLQMGYLPIHVLVSPHHYELALTNSHPDQGRHRDHHQDKGDTDPAGPVEEEDRHSSHHHTYLRPASQTQVAFSAVTLPDKIHCEMLVQDQELQSPPDWICRLKTRLSNYTSSPRAPPAA